MSMCSGKPVIKRPSALASPQAAGDRVRSFASRPRSGGLGLLGSLGLHACLIAAGCAIALIDSGEMGAEGEVASQAGADFIMSSASGSPPSQALPAESPPLPQPALPRVTVAGLLHPSSVVLPAGEPWMQKTPHRNSGSSPAASTTPDRAAAGPGAAVAKAGGRKGAGRGQLGKRNNPDPPPKLLHAPPPPYPAAAKAARKSGKVAVLIQVRADGSAASTRVYQSSGNPQLDRAAVDGARSWRFSRTSSLGSGATVAVVVTVTFAP